MTRTRLSDLRHDWRTGMMIFAAFAVAYILICVFGG